MIFRTASLLLFMIVSNTLTAQAFEKKGTISKEFEITENTEIQITNKYGNIQVITWELDSVKFEVSISVKGNKAYKVDKNFSYIDVEFTANQYYVLANTIFENEKSNFWSDVSDITNSLFKSGSNAQIDISVYVPEENALKLKNKFGNIYLTNQTGPLEIDLSNGDLRANHLSGKTDIKLGFGKATIKTLDNARLDINYGELRVKKAGELFIESKSSEIDCEDSEALRLQSRRDKFYLGNIKKLNGEFSFSTVKIDILETEIFLKTNFGDLLIDQFNPDFSIYNVNSSNTDISSVLSANNGYKLELYYNKKTDLQLPIGLENVEESLINDDDEFYLSASSGEISSKSPTIKINQKGGSIIIINR